MSKLVVKVLLNNKRKLDDNQNVAAYLDQILVFWVFYNFSKWLEILWRSILKKT